MKKICLVFTLLSILFMSCGQQPKEVAMSDDMKNPEELVKPFFADNYPVTDQMLGKGSPNRTTKTAHLIYESTAWFTNDSLKQTLMFMLFSDNTRLVTICFDHNDVPAELMTKSDITDERTNITSDENKLRYFNEFFKGAKKVEAKYFTTNKGFKLGDSKEKAIKQYGEPDSIKMVDGFQKYYWNPAGAQITKQSVPEKDLLLIDEKKQFINMYFKDDKLRALVFDQTPRSDEEGM